MFKSVKKLALFFVLTLGQFFLSACEKTFDETPLPQGQSYVQVWDAYNRPVAYARVKIGDAFYNTDKDGLLVVNTSLTDKAVIKVFKEGYVEKTARVFQGTNAVVVLLMPQMQWKEIEDIEQEQNITLGDIDLIIPANAFITEDGVAAKGTINIAITPWIPEGNLSPASFASNETDQLAPLFSHAMFNIAMIDAQGAPLRLADNSVISVEQKLPADLSLAADQFISLWQLDDATGLWREHQLADISSALETVVKAEISSLGSWSWAHQVETTRQVNVYCSIEEETGAIVAVANDEACYARVQFRYPDKKVSVVDMAVPTAGTTLFLDDDVDVSVLAFHLPSKSFAQVHYSAASPLSDTLNLVAKSGVLKVQPQAVFVDCQFISEGQLPLSIPCEVSAGFRQQGDVYAPWTWNATTVAEGGGLLIMNAPKNSVQKFDVESAYMPECPLETDSPEKYLLYTNSLYKIEHLSFTVQCVDSVYSE